MKGHIIGLVRFHEVFLCFLGGSLKEEGGAVMENKIMIRMCRPMLFAGVRRIAVPVNGGRFP